MAPNLIEHRYRGGSKIAKLRNLISTSDRQPEEWLAATVSRHNQAPLGLARTFSGELLRDLIAANRVEWVGSVAAEGRSDGDVGILFKLLDAGQRLGIHAHPDREFARHHLGSPYGKTEAWLVLDAEPGSQFHLGWASEVTRLELERHRDSQDSDWLLGQMNSFDAEVGMGILVPAGTVHAIDSGIFVAEVQEPSDLSILLEWSITTSSRDQSHLGLGFPTAMDAISLGALTRSELDRLVVRTDLSGRLNSPRRLLPDESDPFFQLHLVAPEKGGSVHIDAGFAVILVLKGAAMLSNQSRDLAVTAGQVFAVPHNFGPWSVTGDAAILIGRAGTAWPGELG